MKLFFTVVLLVNTLFTFAQSKNVDYHLDKEYAISSTGKLILDCSDAKVTITGSSRTTAHVKIDKEEITKGFSFGHREFSVDVSVQDGNLSIRENSSGSVSMIGYHSEKYTIVIELPEGASLTIRGDDGDFDVRNINGMIDMSVDDGDIHLTSCKGNDFRFQLDDGDLTMDSGKGNLDIDADDADVEIRNAQFDNILANVDDGDLIIETSLSNDGSYKITSQDGFVSMMITQGGGEFSVRHDDGHITAVGKFETIRESDDFTELRLAAGSAKVSIKADDARVKLMARN